MSNRSLYITCDLVYVVFHIHMQHACFFLFFFNTVFYICAPGHLEVVKLLVSQGSDKSCKDKRGYTPLHAAAASGHVDVVKYLLRNGAEVSKAISMPQ